MPSEITLEIVEQSLDIIHGKYPQRKDEFFLNLAAVNLLNAAAKKKEFKEIAKYKDIKRYATYLFSLWVADHTLADEASYDIADKCLYIRCHTLQFSFHFIYDKYQPIVEFIHSDENKPTTWDGVRLQPIAVDLLNIAVEKIRNPRGDINDKINEFKQLEIK
ncbi:MAG: hypothetical protein UH071_00260 [Paludibacteraceae bacterium]|nr:hypothetical protein [Paludibacteraceae bacterium]